MFATYLITPRRKHMYPCRDARCNTHERARTCNVAQHACQSYVCKPVELPLGALATEPGIGLGKSGAVARGGVSTQLLQSLLGPMRTTIHSV